ncbi:MAG TPA: response regulator transcription factor [Terriglobales bacterium]|nr:response regulator transcription factor [Terriglobales bacterium]
MTPIRVLIASDYEIVRSSLRQLLNAAEMIDVVGQTDSEALVQAVRDLSPDVVLLEVSRPASGLPAVARLRKKIAQAQILVLSTNVNAAFVRSMLASGAVAYVLKDAFESELYHALRLAARGHRYLDPRLSDALSDLLLGTAGEGIGRPHTKRLSRREAQVLRAIAQGFTGREIAKQYGLSEKTVQTYRARIYEKLELRSRADLVHYALAHGLGWEDSF